MFPPFPFTAAKETARCNRPRRFPPTQPRSSPISSASASPTCRIPAFLTAIPPPPTPSTAVESPPSSAQPVALRPLSVLRNPPIDRLRTIRATRSRRNDARQPCIQMPRFTVSLSKCSPNSTPATADWVPLASVDLPLRVRRARSHGPRCRLPKAPPDPRFPRHSLPISREPVEPRDTIALFVVVPRDGYDGQRFSTTSPTKPSTRVVAVHPLGTWVLGVEFPGSTRPRSRQDKRVLEAGDAARQRSQPGPSRRSSLQTDRCIERRSGVLSHSLRADALLTHRPSRFA